MNPFKIPLAVCFFGCFMFSGCERKDAATAKAIPPATVSEKISEQDLINIKLTPEAEQRLGIRTARVRKQKIARFREYSGDLLLPLGQTSGDASTNASRSVFSLLPMMSPADLVRVAELQVEADGQTAAAEVELEGAQVAFKRAQELISSKAGAGRTVDEARLQVQLAETKLRTAQSRRNLLGAPLFEAVRTNLLWVHVPVYVGDLSNLNLEAPARLYPLGSKTNSPGVEINLVSVPFSSVGSATATDLYYEISGSESFRPGQKFGVAIPLREEAESLVIPSSAILYDIHGDAWVYVKISPQAFARRRVEVRYTQKGRAIISRGLTENVEVVTLGNAELFGTEFGPGK